MEIAYLQPWPWPGRFARTGTCLHSPIASILAPEREQCFWNESNIGKKKGDEFLPDSDGEISIKSLLVDSQRWDGIEDYLQSMKPPITSKRQWGGWAESFCVAWIWEVKVLCFFQNSDDSLSLACEAYGHPHPRYQLCLLWSGTHYDVLTPTDLGGEHSRDDGIVALCLVCSQINISSCPRMFTYNILSIYTYTFACTTSADTQ